MRQPNDQNQPSLETCTKSRERGLGLGPGGGRGCQSGESAIRFRSHLAELMEPTIVWLRAWPRVQERRVRNPFSERRIRRVLGVKVQGVTQVLEGSADVSVRSFVFCFVESLANSVYLCFLLSCVHCFNALKEPKHIWPIVLSLFWADPFMHLSQGLLSNFREGNRLERLGFDELCKFGVGRYTAVRCRSYCWGMSLETELLVFSRRTTFR